MLKNRRKQKNTAYIAGRKYSAIYQIGYGMHGRPAVEFFEKAWMRAKELPEGRGGFESEKLILVCIGAYFLIALFALQLDTAGKFWFLATCVGVFQGAIQALPRSFYSIQLNLYKICDTFTEDD